jgi:myosin-crossreactive antigen
MVYKIYTLQVHDSSGESKTAEKLLALLESVMREAEEDWGVKIAAVCTDALGESWKAWWLLGEKFPHLVTPDCYTHQVRSQSNI